MHRQNWLDDGITSIEPLSLHIVRNDLVVLCKNSDNVGKCYLIIHCRENQGLLFLPGVAEDVLGSGKTGSGFYKIITCSAISLLWSATLQSQTFLYPALTS